MNEEAPESTMPKDLGEQPLERVLIELGVGNHDVVAASTEQMTHKMVARGRKGRRLTRNVQRKILRAVNSLGIRKKAFVVEDLFNYRGK